MNVPLPADPVATSEEDAARQKTHDVTKALAEGKLPTNEQITESLREARESDLIHDSKKDLSNTGKQVLTDAQRILDDAGKIVQNKNTGNVLQDLVYHASASAETDHSQTAKVAAKHGELPNLKSTDLTSKSLKVARLLATNSEFKNLLFDLLNIAQDCFSDVIRNAASQAKAAGDISAEAEKKIHKGLDKAHDTVCEVKEKNEKQEKQADKPSEKPSQGNVQLPEKEGADIATDARKKAADATHALADKLGQTDKSLKELGQEQYNKGKDVAEQVKGISGHLADQLGQLELSDEKVQELSEKFKTVVKQIQSKKDYQEAVDFLIDLVYNASVAVNTVGNNAKKVIDTAATEDPNLLMAKEDAKQLLENFANNKSLDPLASNIQKLQKSAESDAELQKYFADMQTFVTQSLREPTVLDDPKYNSRAKELASRGKKLLNSDKYKGTFNDVWKEASEFLEALGNDKEFQQLSNDVSSLASDIFLDANGKPTLKPELLSDARIFVPRLASQLRFLPIPRIEHTDEEIDYVLDNVVVTCDQILPRYLKVSQTTEFDARDAQIDIGKAPDATVLTQLKLSHVSAASKNIKFFYRKKKGLTKMSDWGFIDVSIGGPNKEGLSLDIIMGPDLTAKKRTFDVRRVDVKIQGLDVKLHDTKHDIMYKLLLPFFTSYVKSEIEKAIKTQILNAIFQLDEVAVKRAEQAKEIAQDELAKNSATTAPPATATAGPSTSPASWGSKAFNPTLKQ